MSGNYLASYVKSKVLAVLARVMGLGGQLDLSREALEKAVKLEPWSAEWYYRLGLIHIRAGRPKEAIVRLEAAVHLRPDHCQYHYWLGKALEQAGELRRSEEAYTRSLQIKSRPHTLEALARVQHKLGLLEAAATNYGLAATFRPQAGVLNNRGLCLAQLGRYEEALSCYQRALRLSPRDPVILYNQGILLQRLGRWEESLNLLHQAAEAGLEEEANLLAFIALSYSQLGRYQEAITYYRRALKQAPADAMVMNELASCLHRAGYRQESWPLFAQALELAPTDITLLNNYALCLDNAGRYEEALALYNRGLALAPRHQVLLANKAGCLLKWGKYRRALALFRYGTRHYPHHHEFWWGKGLCLDHLGLEKEALEAYNRALELQRGTGRPVDVHPG